jgi:hypothetical protein
MTRAWLISLLMFVWLTVGYAVVHVIVTLWGISIVDAMFPDPRPIEVLHVTNDGEALIQSYSNGHVQGTFRRLDGSQVSETAELQRAFASGTQLVGPDHTEPNSWDVRLSSFSDFQKPATNWYAIAPPGHAGTAYFVGYDYHSRRLAGYLGVNGFSHQQPTTDQSFPIDSSQYFAFNGILVSSQHPHQYGYAVEPAGDLNFPTFLPANIPVDAVWLLSQGNIYEIRLRARAVRVLVADRPEMRSLARAARERDGKSYLELLVRTDTGLLLIDPASGNTISLPLDPVAPDAMQTFYRLSDDRYALVVRGPSLLNPVASYAMTWMDNAGHVQRRAEITVHDSKLMLVNSFWMCIPAFPAPIVSLGALFVVPGVMPPSSAETQSYSGRFWQFLHEFRGWIVTSSLAGVLTAWACRRRECRVFGRSGWFWPILVGTCGWFGWIGYACLRPQPARQPQGGWLPAQPEPGRPLGTEVFA